MEWIEVFEKQKAELQERLNDSEIEGRKHKILYRVLKSEIRKLDRTIQKLSLTFKET